MLALKKNRTWDVVEMSRERSFIGWKWVFTIKDKLDGSIEHYKVRLVVKGFSQTYGVHYQMTLTLIAKLNTVWVLFSLVANLDWKL